MRVLAAVVVPPHMSASGGSRAAELLSLSLADTCDITIANMMRKPVVDPGRGRARRLPVNSWLPPLLPWSRLPNRYSTLFYRSDLPAIVRDGNFDLVHIHNPMPALEMERVARACLVSGVPYVVSTHGFNEIANGGEIYGFDPLRRLMWKHLVQGPVSRVVARASGVFALSPADFDIVRGLGYAGQELSIVANGVDAPGAPAPGADAEALARMDIPVERTPGEIACMFLANHTPNKGLPVLLDAFAALKRPYLLIVAGEKREGVDYERYARACGPGQRIVVTGRLSDGEVQAAMRRSDLFVFPTLADTFPLVVLEAMSNGLPVLATRVGGIPHQLDGGCGRLVEPGDPEALRAAVDELAADPARLADMGRNAKSRAAARFTWAKAAEDALAGYRRILSARPLGRREGQGSTLAAGWTVHG